MEAGAALAALGNSMHVACVGVIMLIVLAAIEVMQLPCLCLCRVAAADRERGRESESTSFGVERGRESE